MIFTYRPALPDDRRFIVSGWSSSLRMTRDLPLITMADYADIMHPQIEKTLDRTGVQTIVAGGSVLAGFITFECEARLFDDRGWANADYVFYVYVASFFRKRGVARDLFRTAGIDPASRFHYACRTHGSWELRSKIPLAHYSPMYARYSPEETAQHERDHRRERKGRRA